MMIWNATLVKIIRTLCFLHLLCAFSILTRLERRYSFEIGSVISSLEFIMTGASQGTCILLLMSGAGCLSQLLIASVMHFLEFTFEDFVLIFNQSKFNFKMLLQVINFIFQSFNEFLFARILALWLTLDLFVLGFKPVVVILE